MGPRRGRLLMAALAVVAGFAGIAAGSPSAQTAARHDLGRRALAAYVSLRFSPAVPQGVIRKVLAGEGFSKRDLRLVGEAAHARAPATSAGRSLGLAPLRMRRSGSRVTRVRQISRDTLPCPTVDPGCELDTQAEPDIAANPTDGRNLVGTFQVGRYPDAASVVGGFATTFNDGRSWIRGDLPGLTVGGPHGGKYQRASDPVVAFDRKHKRAYISTLAVASEGCFEFCDTALPVSISRNGGRTFSRPVIAHEDVSSPTGKTFRLNDKNWIVVDNNPRSPYYGRTYIVWDQIRCQAPNCTGATQPVMVTYSDDGGRSWHKAIQATPSRPAQRHAAIGVQPVVLPNGNLVVVYVDVQAGGDGGDKDLSGDYSAIRSTDGGRTWSKPVTVASADPYSEQTGGLRAPNLPSADNYRSRIYVAFQDQRLQAGRNDILLAHSPDGGRTWTYPVNATPGEANLDHFTPAISARRHGVDLTYSTRKPGLVSDSPWIQHVYRRVGKRGRKPGTPRQLGGLANADVAAYVGVAGPTAMRFFGDYVGIASTGRFAHPIWTRSHRFSDRTPNPTDTYQRAYSARAR